MQRNAHIRPDVPTCIAHTAVLLEIAEVSINIEVKSLALESADIGTGLGDIANPAEGIEVPLTLRNPQISHLR